jgi:HD-like signal output (HDOD) protein
MSVERLSVLFVDDEQKIIDGLRRQLRMHREQWDMRFALSGDSALEMLAQQPADVIVTDMRMPGMTGGRLLARVREMYPQTTRLILSGQTDQADLLSELGCIHQYLQKPCDGESLCCAIERTRTLSRQLSEPALRLAANRVTALPPSSQTYRRLVSELTKEDASLSTVATLVGSDPALSVKLMQLVNSAFFGMPRKVNSPQEAVVLLGLNTIHGIVVAGRVFEFASKGAADAGTISKIWEASVKLGESAASFAKKDGAANAVVAEARLSGLLCLIGRAILMTASPESYAKVTAGVGQGKSYQESEKAVFGATQDEVTAYALGLWVFSDELSEAAAFQSRPSRLAAGKRNDLIAYLHLARATHQTEPLAPDAGPALDGEFLMIRGFSTLGPCVDKAVA